MKNSVKKTYLKNVHINNYVSVHLFETSEYFGVEVIQLQDKKLNKRNQFKKEKYDSLEDCLHKAETRFHKHIKFITQIIEDSKFQTK